MSINKSLFSFRLITALVLVLCVATGYADPGDIDQSSGKPRILVLTDMGNEPDDQMSMVRLLLYANELEIEGLVATTSTWLRDSTNPQTIRKIIGGYSEVRENLMLHASGWPEAAALAERVSMGQPAYGIAAIGSDKMSPGAQAIINAADKDDPRPLWISVWGGANTLAQALLHVRETRTAEALEKFIANLRVYSISDQDDAGPWIRREFPGLEYVAKPSSPDGDEYGYATWTGIAGDVYYRNGMGADTSLITNEWLEENIRAKGSYGKLYPSYLFIMEGDTPAFLNLLNNGLESHRSPAWGGWGGRYLYRQPYGETRSFWTQGGDMFGRVTSQDEVVGMDGRVYASDHGTIWRWREAFQHDFAARMDWTFQDFENANHPPKVVINADDGSGVLYLKLKEGESVTLDAGATVDPDKDNLSFHWFHYPEAGFVKDTVMADISIGSASKRKTTVTAVKACRDPWLPELVGECKSNGVAHLILAVRDSGEPALTRYRRVVIQVSPGE